MGIEPTTFCLEGRRSTAELHPLKLLVSPSCHVPLASLAFILHFDGSGFYIIYYPQFIQLEGLWTSMILSEPSEL
jgi:hypothetical protein